MNEAMAIATQLRRRGFDVRVGKHIKVYDPETGGLMTVFPKTPSDHRWLNNLRSQLRRLGIDLDAKPTTVVQVNGKEQEMKDNDLKATPERVRAIRDTLTELLVDEGVTKTFLEEMRRERMGSQGGIAAVPEFVRIAIEEVGPKLGLRVWKSEKSGYNTVTHLLSGKPTGMQRWTADLLESTADYVRELTIEAEAVPPEAQPETVIESEIEPELEIEPEPIMEANGHNEEREAEYFTTLIQVLARDGWRVESHILDRLDKLAGVR